MTKDTFIGKTVNVGGSLIITIPSRNVQYSGLKTGMLVKIWYEKVDEE